MKVQELINNKEIYKLKYIGNDVPHIYMETNQNCNVQCRNCCNFDKGYVKSLDEVKRDIDTAVKVRNLETITLAGGEPTLHPDIIEIAKYVKSKGLVCQLGSNCRFILEGNEELLDKLINAGVDRIFVHIDEGQPHIKNVFEALDIVVGKLEKKKMWYLVSQIIYSQNKEIIPAIIKRYANNKYFSGILATIGADFTDENKYYDENRIKEVSENIYKELGVLPISYTPASLDDDEVSWLSYLFYTDSKGNNSHGASKLYYQWFLKMYRKVKGVHAFAFTYSNRLFNILLPFNMLFELIFNAKNIKSLANVIRGGGIKLKYVVIQNGPRYNQGLGKYQICYNCPDATIRNGRLTPECVSDLVNAINTGEVRNEELCNDVYEHLSEHYTEDVILYKAASKEDELVG